MYIDELFIKHFWLTMVVAHGINCLWRRFNIKEHIRADSNRKKGYNEFLRGCFIIGNLPSLIIGVGVLTGTINTTFDALDRNISNPIPFAIMITLLAIWTAGVVWIYFKNGAKFLEKHPGLFFNSFTFLPYRSLNSGITAKQIKLQLLLFFVPFPFVLIHFIVDSF
jgi:hypothetical protein